MLTIERVINGWVLTDHRMSESDPFVYVFQTDDLAAYDASVWAQVLHQINELVGPVSTRYDKERVYIEVRPGDKCED